MKTPFWIGYYLNQNCIIHPDTGRWHLVGYFNDQIICEKYEDGKSIDCMYYDISEVKFILRKINPFLFLSMSKFFWWIKSEALSGYWMNFDSKFDKQIIFESWDTQNTTQSL